MWPQELYGEEIFLRPARFRDRSKWNEVRAENKEWLTPWEATLPKVPAGTPASEFVSKRPSFFEMVHALMHVLGYWHEYLTFVISVQGVATGVATLVWVLVVNSPDQRAASGGGDD